MKNDLFGEFPNVSKSEWLEQVSLDLKGKDIEHLVFHELKEGIRLSPFYTIEDRSSGSLVHAYKDMVNPFPDTPGTSARHWSNVAVFDGKDERSTNLSILEVLQQGADALLLQLEGSENLDLLLKDVAPQYIEIYLQPKHEPLLVLEGFLKWLDAVGADKLAVKGGLLFDNYACSLTKKSHKSNVIRCAANLLEIGKQLPTFKTLCLDTAVYHNAGSDAAQEVAFAIAGYVDLLDELIKMGYSPATLLAKTFIKTAVGGDFFKEIAKIRALRISIHQLAFLYEVNISPDSVFIFAETSFWTKSAKDLETNMLRNTTEAMAAVLGGCNALHVLRHDVATSRPVTSFAQRMALNISNLLKEEAYLDKHVDPVSGSYYLEKLITELLAKVKDKLLHVEAVGGWWVDYQIGKMQKEVMETRISAAQQLLNEEVIKIGVNKYKAVADREELPLQLDQEQEYWQLFPSRASLLAE
jgi:methylmalonyl-CoA mutase